MNTHACAYCGAALPARANFCPACGRPAVREPERREPERYDNSPETGGGEFFSGFSVFLLSIAASLALSWVLITVFHLPVFFIAGFLPLFGAVFRRRK